MSAQMKPETIVLHAGPRSDSSTGAVAVPIFQTTSYQFRSTEHAANLFALRDFRQHAVFHRYQRSRRDSWGRVR